MVTIHFGSRWGGGGEYNCWKYNHDIMYKLAFQVAYKFLSNRWSTKENIKYNAFIVYCKIFTLQFITLKIYYNNGCWTGPLCRQECWKLSSIKITNHRPVHPIIWFHFISVGRFMTEWDSPENIRFEINQSPLILKIIIGSWVTGF